MGVFYNFFFARVNDLQRLTKMIYGRVEVCLQDTIL